MYPNLHQNITFKGKSGLNLDKIAVIRWGATAFG